MADEVVVAGGAAIGLLITDPANPTVRPTQDLDVIVEVINRADSSTLIRIDPSVLI